MVPVRWRDEVVIASERGFTAAKEVCTSGRRVVSSWLFHHERCIIGNENARTSVGEVKYDSTAWIRLPSVTFRLCCR